MPESDSNSDNPYRPIDQNLENSLGDRDSTVRRSLPRRFLNRLEVDQAVFYAILARAWQFVAGPITIIMIANFFSEEVQGYYYAFWGVVALQQLFELGFPQAILNFASHQWSSLETDSTDLENADPDTVSRLSSLLRSSLVCYAVTAFLSTLLVFVCGWIMFSRDQYSDQVSWRIPWTVMSLLSMLVFAASPLLIILEGCNQVKAVYKMQFARAVFGNIAVWVAIFYGANLWTLVFATIVKLICEGYLILVIYRKLFAKLIRKPSGPTIDWRTRIWPFQRRIAIGGFFGYLNIQILNPVTFIYVGAIPAGQLGMVLQILTAVQAACSSWVRTRAAAFGILVAKQDFKELDRVFYRVSHVALWILLAVIICFCVVVWGLHWFQLSFANRLLGPLETIGLAAGFVAITVMEFQMIYMHAHQRAPFFFIGIICAIASGLLVWWWGMLMGVTGACFAFFVINVLVKLPLFCYLFSTFSRAYHAEREQEA